MSRLQLLQLVVLLALVASVVGCGKPGPKQVAAQFVAAMVQSDNAAASKCWDWVNYARENNDNWDSIPPAQRKLILEKTAVDESEQMAQYQQYFPVGTAVGEATVTGIEATATLTGSSATLHLLQSGGQWYVDAVDGGPGQVGGQLPG